jgi:mxaJ protein
VRRLLGKLLGSVFGRWAVIAAAVLLAGASGAGPRAEAAPRPLLRVCADPNNLPFSNRAGEGFENRLATVLARAMGADLQYTWWAQRRGFVRNTLTAGKCDVIMGVAAGVDALAHTRAYYRSTYVFATAAARRPIASFDDPALHRLRIGIALIGDDGANPPPEYALARRGIVDNVVGYGVYGDYARPDPGLRPLEALARGEIDVAAVWGPLAGYYARRRHAHFRLTPIRPVSDSGLPFVFDITLGLRRGASDEALRGRLDRALRDQRAQIEQILDEYGIPRV